jgi:hypothetical protein
MSNQAIDDLDIMRCDTIEENEKEDLEMKPKDVGTHFYRETVSTTIDSNEMYDFFLDIFIQASLGKLPKSSPEEVKQLVSERFDQTIAKYVEPELPEYTVPPIEDHSEQYVCNQLKRQRVDSDV